MTLFGKIFGDDAEKQLRSFAPTVEEINSHEKRIEALSDEQLRNQTDEFKKRLSAEESLEDILPQAFAVVREAAKRTLNQRHYDVQLLGGIILHKNSIAEMKTGEGKTLVATLPVYLNALTGKGVHVVTVNDYLSRRDAVWMGQIYDTLGLSVGIINSDNTSYLYDPGHLPAQAGKDIDKERDEKGGYKVFYDFLRPCERKESYAADITYGTNNEFGFDYLRDNIAYEENQIAQRGYYYAVVDEIDSILIDEARTPLIISAPAQESGDLYKTFARIAGTLQKEKDFTIDEKQKAIQLTDDGIEKVERTLGVDNIYTEGGIKYVHHLETAVRARALFERDKEYVVRNGEVIIVDEFTGRLQPGRRWSEGLHQAIEAKEGVDIQRESRTVASITFQNYFRLYEKLSGMTGTALTSQEEFYKVYGLNVTSVPTNKPIARLDRNDLIYQTEEGKFKAIARKVKELNEKGQPVLIGTVSIEKNELLSAYLRKEGVTHKLLNAKQHENEGEIIAEGGKKGSVTVATNMAGRGVDIKLGGPEANESESEEIKSLGGLFVLGTERHEARRIDNQLRGRAGRQGDAGETQFFVSLEDSLMRVFASEKIKGMMGRFGISEDQPIENKMITRALESAQEKIEGFNFDARKQILSYDDVLNQQRTTIYSRRHALLSGTQEEIVAFADEVIAADPSFADVIEVKKSELGEEVFWQTFRKLSLQVIDMLWMEHLEVMDYLRSSVGLRGYGQRDPLVEYKKEGLHMFRELEESLMYRIADLSKNLGGGAFAREQMKLRAAHEKAYQFGAVQKNGGGQNAQMVNSGKKIGRNEIIKITNGTETKELKYKKAEELLNSGEWKIVT